MKLLCLSLITAQLLLAIFPLTVTYFLRNRGGSTWIDLGYLVMDFRFVMIGLFFLIFLLALFLNIKLNFKIVILISSVIGSYIYFTSYTYPF